MKNIVSTFALVCVVPILWAWDGIDSESGANVEIQKGNLVRQGSEIEFYDHEAGEYRNGTVESIRSYGSGAEVEIHDHESGETRTLEMD